MEKIRLKAMLLIYNEGKLLVSKGFDTVKQQDFYRLLGGSIEFGETAEIGIRREISEELQSEIIDLKLINVIENLFTFQGKRGHEIDYLYSGILSRAELFGMDHIPLNESYGEFFADWVPISSVLDKGIPLYPPYDYNTLLSL